MRRTRYDFVSWPCSGLSQPVPPLPPLTLSLCAPVASFIKSAALIIVQGCVALFWRHPSRLSLSDWTRFLVRSPSRNLVTIWQLRRPWLHFKLHMSCHCRLYRPTLNEPLNLSRIVPIITNQRTIEATRFETKQKRRSSFQSVSFWLPLKKISNFRLFQLENVWFWTNFSSFPRTLHWHY